MKRVICIILFCTIFSHNFLFGQNVLERFTGVVFAENEKTLNHVICKILTKNNDILTYTISGENGSFILSGEKEKAFFLSFELMGYHSKKVEISNITNISNIKIVLEESPYTLPDIEIRIPPIQKKNDTIVYNAISFVGQEDRYLNDLLKKLPGIKVNDNGSLSYQGEAINNFYIEGNDLLGGQYLLATRNVPVDAVSQVEVLENHKHEKVLKGIEHSNQAAINIKLKKNHLFKPFGEVSVGIGGFPALYSLKTFAMQVGTKYQTVLNIKANNTGIDISDEAENVINVSDIFLIDMPPDNLFISEKINNLPISLDHYLFNKSYLGSINNLISLSDETKIKISASYTKNRIDQEINFRQIYGLIADNLVINEISNIHNKIGDFNGSILFEHNSHGKYLKNEFSLTNKQLKSGSGINSNMQKKDILNVYYPMLIKNDFQALIKYKDNKTIKINSYLRHLNRKESLNINLNDSLINNSFGENFLLFKNKISTSFLLFGQNLDMGLTFNYKLNGIEENLLKPVYTDNNDFHKSEEKQSILSFNYQIRNGSQFVTTLNIPVNYFQYEIENSQSHVLEDRKLIITPTLSNYYTINYLWKINFRLGSDWNYGDFLFNSANQYLRNHRVTYIPSSFIPNRKSFFIGGGIKFADLSKLLFFDSNLMFRILNFNYASKIFHTPEMSFYTIDPHNNIGQMLVFNTNISKSFIPSKLALTLSPNFTQLTSMMIQQDSLISNKSNVASITLKAELKKIKNFYVNYQISNHLSWQNNKLTNKLTRNDIEQKLIIFYFPKKNIDLSSTAEMNLLEMDDNEYFTFTFVDFRGRYKYKNCEFDLSMTNILNNNKYSRIYYTSVNSTFQTIPLRGRECLFTVKFKF